MKKQTSTHINENDFGKYVNLFVVFLFFLIALNYFIGYWFPEMERLEGIQDKQNKQLTCLDNGYFDYEEANDVCYDLGRINVDNFECVEKGECKGRH